MRTRQCGARGGHSGLWKPEGLLACRFVVVVFLFGFKLGFERKVENMPSKPRWMTPQRTNHSAVAVSAAARDGRTRRMRRKQGTRIDMSVEVKMPRICTVDSVLAT